MQTEFPWENETYQQMSSCANQQWCCQVTVPDAPWCCNDDTLKFPLANVIQEYISIPLSKNSTDSPTYRLGKIAIGIGIGVGLGVTLTLIMTIGILYFLRTRHRREIPTASVAVAQTSKLENVRVVAHREFGLPGSRPLVVELPG